MPIPPHGWGAVESLIWDYKIELERLGHNVQIVNTPNKQEILNQVNNFNPDFVHLQYDDFFDIMPDITCKNKAATTHYGYLEQPNRYGGYGKVIMGFIEGSFNVICLSDGIKKIYEQFGANTNRLYVVGNGARKDSIKVSYKNPAVIDLFGKYTGKEKDSFLEKLTTTYQKRDVLL